MSYYELTTEQRALADFMSDLSEECYCAGWLEGLEFGLWGFVIHDVGTFGQADILQVDIDRLRQLSAACGGWIVWRDEDSSETFLPMAEWLALYKKQRGKCESDVPYEPEPEGAEEL